MMIVFVFFMAMKIAKAAAEALINPKAPNGLSGTTSCGISGGSIVGAGFCAAGFSSARAGL